MNGPISITKEIEEAAGKVVAAQNELHEEIHCRGLLFNGIGRLALRRVKVSLDVFDAAVRVSKERGEQS